MGSGGSTRGFDVVDGSRVAGIISTELLEIVFVLPNFQATARAIPEAPVRLIEREVRHDQSCVLSLEPNEKVADSRPSNVLVSTTSYLSPMICAAVNHLSRSPDSALPLGTQWRQGIVQRNRTHWAQSQDKSTEETKAIDRDPSSAGRF